MGAGIKTIFDICEEDIGIEPNTDMGI